MTIPKTTQFLGTFQASLDSGVAPNFEQILRELDGQAKEVQSLRARAADKLAAAQDKAEQLGREHTQATRFSLFTHLKITSLRDQVD